MPYLFTVTPIPFAVPLVLSIVPPFMVKLPPETKTLLSSTLPLIEPPFMVKMLPYPTEIPPSAFNSDVMTEPPFMVKLLLYPTPMPPLTVLTVPSFITKVLPSFSIFIFKFIAPFFSFSS